MRRRNLNITFALSQYLSGVRAIDSAPHMQACIAGVTEFIAIEQNRFYTASGNSIYPPVALTLFPTCSLTTSPLLAIERSSSAVFTRDVDLASVLVSSPFALGWRTVRRCTVQLTSANDFVATPGGHIT